MIGGFGHIHRSFKTKAQLTQRAADKWDSARFQAFFVSLSFFRSQAESTPAHLSANASRWVLSSNARTSAKTSPALQESVGGENGHSK